MSFFDLFGNSPYNSAATGIKNNFAVALLKAQTLLSSFNTAQANATNALNQAQGLTSNATVGSKAQAVAVEAQTALSNFSSILSAWNSMQGDILSTQQDMADPDLSTAWNLDPSQISGATLDAYNSTMNDAVALTNELTSIAAQMTSEIAAANTALQDAGNITNLAEGKGAMSILSSIGSGLTGSVTTVAKDVGMVLAAGAVIYAFMILPKRKKS